ncbi:MAG: winged helix-turn-helix domain-containing protein [Betaproteobacteria bacterium]
MRSYRFEGFELLPALRQVHIDGRPATIGSRAFDVLLALVEHAGRVVTKDELLALVWPGTVVEEANVQVQVSTLRKLLGQSAIATVSGRGYRLTASPLREDVETPAASGRHHLPQPRTAFIGRELALSQCVALLARHRLLTLTGLGGCGKTRLGLQLAHRVLGDFPDGAWFVDLAPLRAGSDVASAVAAALDVSEDAETPLVGRLAAHLAGRRLLLVLDNCEHVAAPVAALIEAVLSAAPQVKILATSRQALRLGGEQAFQVLPLSLPDASDPAASEAVRLFIDRAELAWPGFSTAAGDLEDIAAICRRLDGIALAIELAAARVGMLSVHEIGTRLDDRFRFLADSHQPLARHQTLESALQWSYETLSPADQQVLRALAVFAGGCTLASAARVCALADEHEALERLTSLNDKSLLAVDRGTRETRYGMLETVRCYAHERLVEAGEEVEAARRHRHDVLVLAREAMVALQGPRQGEWMQRLRREQENIVVAQLHCLADPAGGDDALELVVTLSRYWLNSAQLERGHAFACAALERAGRAPDPTWHCRALAATGAIAFRMGRYDETLIVAEQSLALARTLGTAAEIAAALALKSKGLHATGQDRLALECAAQTCVAARELGITTRLSAALNNLAEIHRGLGDLAAARACYEEAIVITRQLGYQGGTFVSLCNLARLLITTDELADARGLLLEGLMLWSAAGLKSMGKDLLECSSGLAARSGDAIAAARFAGSALARLDEAAIRREQVDEGFIAPLLSTARHQIGDAAFEAAMAHGRALAYEASMAEVQAWLAPGV